MQRAGRPLPDGPKSTDPRTDVPTRAPIAALAAAPLLLAACFPTMQTARIDPGFHLDGSVVVLGDQERNGEPQGTDIVAAIGPSYGFGDRFEVGVPVGLYLEEGLESLGSDWESEFGTSPRQFVLWPYLKTALLPRGSRDHLALHVQGAWLVPANVGLRYGHDLGSWEPHAGITVIFSGGAAGDDPFVTRYQEEGQFLLALSAGASFDAPGRPAVEVGLLRNHYNEGAVYGDFGQPLTPRTLYDLYVGARFRLFRH
jgi:hypothetical protein